MKEKQNSHQLILLNRNKGYSPYELEIPKKYVSSAEWRKDRIEYGSFVYVLAQCPAFQRKIEVFPYVGSNCGGGDIETRLRNHLGNKFSMNKRLSVLALMQFENYDIQDYTIDRWEAIFYFAMKCIVPEVSKKTRRTIRFLHGDEYSKQKNRPHKKTCLELEKRYPDGLTEINLNHMDELDFRLKGACDTLKPLLTRFCKNKTML